MSNVYTTNPITIDTVTAAAVNITKMYIIKSIEWSRPTTVDHKANVQDKDGNQLADFNCTVANQNMIKHFEPPEPVYGLHIPTLGSGKIYITRL